MVKVNLYPDQDFGSGETTSEPPVLDPHAWYSQPATSAQTNYLKFLVRQAGKNTEWFYDNYKVDLNKELLKIQASKLIEAMLNLPALLKLAEGAPAQPVNQQDLDDEHTLCGYDAFGNQEPYICQDAVHKHPVSPETLARYNLRHEQRLSELPQPRRPVVQSSETPPQTPRTGHPKLNNPNTQPQRSFRLENPEQRIQDG